MTSNTVTLCSLRTVVTPDTVKIMKTIMQLSEATTASCGVYSTLALKGLRVRKKDEHVYLVFFSRITDYRNLKGRYNRPCNKRLKDRR